METWKNIFKNYQISDNGRIKSQRRIIKMPNGGHRVHEERILKPYHDKDGYLVIQLCVDGKVKYFLIHRLVAMAFIPNPNNLPQVNHIDGNKENVCASNLEWCTCRENIQHAYDKGLKKASQKQKEIAKKINAIKVIQFDLQGNYIKEWDSASEAARQLNIDQSGIIKCCRNKLKTAGKYKWKYTDTQ